MNDEFDLADTLELVYKKRKKIIKFTLLIVLIVFAVSIIMPKTYVSESSIQLPEVPTMSNGLLTSELLFQPYQIKELIESSVILQPAIDKVFADEDKPSVEDLVKKIKIEMTQGLTDQYGRPMGLTSPYMKIKVSENNANKSAEINSAILDELSKYVDDEFGKQKILVTESHNRTIERMENEIKVREASIKTFEEDIASLETQINSMNLGAEALAQSTLMRAISDTYEQRLADEKNSKMWAEQNLIDEKVDLEQELAELKEFRIISEPGILKTATSPNIKLNMLIALVLGLFASVIWVFLHEAIRK